jgi:hypothetical protein
MDLGLLMRELVMVPQRVGFVLDIKRGIAGPDVKYPAP